MTGRLSLRSQLVLMLGGLALAMLAGVGLYLGRLAAAETALALAAAAALAAWLLAWRLAGQMQHLQAAHGSLQAQLQVQAAALQSATEALELLATRDPLTGLHNRRSLDARLAEAHGLDRRYGRQNGRVHGLMLIEVDHFKDVNDRFGHPAGDAVLCQLAALLQQSVRATDLVARVGGEAFAVLLPGCANALEVVMAAEKIRSAVAVASFAAVGPVTVSVGVSLASPEDGLASALVARADAALYEAKHGGRNAVALRAPDDLNSRF